MPPFVIDPVDIASSLNDISSASSSASSAAAASAAYVIVYGVSSVAPRSVLTVERVGAVPTITGGLGSAAEVDVDDVEEAATVGAAPFSLTSRERHPLNEIVKEKSKIKIEQNRNDETSSLNVLRTVRNNVEAQLTVNFASKQKYHSY
ncbi:MAG: hypothetical protein A3K03_12110 [Bdellovibrionales bacterium RIFOXYD1_FULL_44_7]|nr:MAG: hypothetical protein A3K03_12110 [Bdellovibrionales bacterium RIFOXYD1_FULL_44_7]